MYESLAARDFKPKETAADADSGHGGGPSVSSTLNAKDIVMDLSTTYLGLKLRSPLVPSAAAPLTEDIDNIKQMEDAGAAAVVLYSLFEEQLRLERQRIELSSYARHGEFSRSADVFPRAGGISRRPGAIPQTHRQGEGGGEDSHHRQPERLDARRLDGLREDKSSRPAPTRWS